MKPPQLINNDTVVQATGLIYRVKTPSGSGPHPTAVLIHGRLGNEEVMWVFARTLPPNFLILSVRAPVAEGEGYSWHPPGNSWPVLSDFDASVTAVSHFIRALPEHYNADPNRIFLMGFSQGAAAAFVTAIKNPGLVQGVAGLVGFLPLDIEEAIDSLPLDNVPIFMAVGKKDPAIPIDLARKSGKKLIAAGAQLEYHEFDTGHKINGEGMRELATWWESHNNSI